jgi:hypothetical protein
VRWSRLAGGGRDARSAEEDPSADGETSRAGCELEVRDGFCNIEMGKHCVPLEGNETTGRTVPSAVRAVPVRVGRRRRLVGGDGLNGEIARRDLARLSRGWEVELVVR